MQTLAEVIAKARELAAGAPKKDPVAFTRQPQAAMIADTLASSGFPVTEDAEAKLSLVPLVF